jgi:hypothetical protein
MKPTRGQKPKSPARESAKTLLTRLHDLAGTLDAIEGTERACLRGLEPDDPAQWQPGHAIVTCLNDVGASESVRRKVSLALRRIIDRARSFLMALGDDGRQRNVAAPLCWLPGDPPPPPPALPEAALEPGTPRDGPATP